MTRGILGADAQRARWVALLVAMVISTCGDEIALIVLALKLSNGAATMAGVSALLVAGLVPGILLAPWVGRLVDSVTPVPLLVGALLAEGGVALAMAWTDSEPVVIGLAVVLGALGAVVSAATMTVIPRVVADARLTQASSVVEVARNAGYLAGPAAAGALVAVGGTTLGLVANAASFVVAAILVPLLPAAARRAVLPDPAGKLAAQAPTRSIDGFRFFAMDPVLRRVMPAILVAVAATSMFNVAFVFHVRQGLGLSEAAYGWLVFGISAGLVAGPVVLRAPLHRANQARLAVACAGMIGGAMVVSAIVRPPVAVLAALLVLGVFNAGQNVALRVVVLRRAPEGRRGSVAAGYGALLQTAVGLGFALAAFPDPSASREVIVIGGAAAVAAALVGQMLMSRSPRVPADPAPADPDPGSPAPVKCDIDRTTAAQSAPGAPDEAIAER